MRGGASWINKSTLNKSSNVTIKHNLTSSRVGYMINSLLPDITCWLCHITFVLFDPCAHTRLRLVCASDQNTHVIWHNQQVISGNNVIILALPRSTCISADVLDSRQTVIISEFTDMKEIASFSQFHSSIVILCNSCLYLVIAF